MGSKMPLSDANSSWPGWRLGCRAVASKQPACLLLARGTLRATSLGLAKLCHSDTMQLSLVCVGRAVHQVPWCGTHLGLGTHVASWYPATSRLQG